MTRAKGGRSPTLSGREFARLAMVSHTAVQNWIDAGLIPIRPDGKLDRADALVAVQHLVEDREADRKERGELAKVRAELTLARRDRERALARLRELELSVESGQYVELALVERDGHDTAERVLAVLRSIPQRTAMAVEGVSSAAPSRRAAVVEQIISVELERAIGELRESMYIKPVVRPKRAT